MSWVAPSGKSGHDGPNCAQLGTFPAATASCWHCAMTSDETTLSFHGLLVITPGKSATNSSTRNITRPSVALRLRRIAFETLETAARVEVDVGGREMGASIAVMPVPYAVRVRGSSHAVRKSATRTKTRTATV